MEAKMSDDTVVPFEDHPVVVADRVAKAPIKLGQQADAALRERAAKAGETVFLYNILGEDFKIQFPLSAATLMHVSTLTSGDGVNYEAFTDALVSLFAREDQAKVLEALRNPKGEIVPDVEYLSDIFSEVMEVVNDRPTTS